MNMMVGVPKKGFESCRVMGRDKEDDGNSGFVCESVIAI